MDDADPQPFGWFGLKTVEQQARRATDGNPKQD